MIPLLASTCTGRASYVGMPAAMPHLEGLVVPVREGVVRCPSSLFLKKEKMLLELFFLFFLSDLHLRPEYLRLGLLGHHVKFIQGKLKIGPKKCFVNPLHGS